MSTHSGRNSQAQIMEALALANQTRLAHMNLKRQVRAGEVSVSDVILGSHPDAGGMKVRDLLAARKGWATVKTSAFLREMHISEVRRVRDLTDRQRAEIVEALYFIDSIRRSHRRGVAA
jgi:hypothetical protein